MEVASRLDVVVLTAAYGYHICWSSFEVLDSISLAFSPHISLSIECIINQKCHVRSRYRLCLLLMWDAVLG